MANPVFPNEILAQVVQRAASHNDANLSSIALVNTSCADAVRDVRFAEVSLTHNGQSIKLVVLLLMQMLRQQRATGAYIHKLSVRLRSDHLFWSYNESRPHQFTTWASQLREVLNERPVTLPQQDGAKEAHDMCCLLETWSGDREDFDGRGKTDIFMASVIAVMRRTMLNLKFLNWEMEKTMKPEVRHALTDCFYRLDRLDRLALKIPGHDLIRAEIVPERMHLRHLSLDCDLSHLRFPPQGDATVTTDAAGPTLQGNSFQEKIHNILLACAPQLRSLSLGFKYDSSQAGLAASGVSIDFPVLEMLRIRGLVVARGTSSRQPGVDALWLRGENFPLMIGIGRTPQLKGLDFPSELSEDIWTADAEWPGDTVRFLGKQTHLEHLRIGECHSSCLDNSIIPALGAGRFSSLTYLSLIWNFKLLDNEGAITTYPGVDESILPVQLDPSSLACIGQIKTLRQLELGIYYTVEASDDYWICEWVVDHIGMRSLLQGLERLELLAITGDSWVHRFNPTSYYIAANMDKAQIRMARGAGNAGEVMIGSWRDMVDLRARPELDDNCFIGKPDYRMKPVWKPKDASTGGDPGRRVTVKDRYCDVYPDFYPEIIQRNCALTLAEEYAATFPKLRMIYLGRVCMKILVAGSGHHGNAVPIGDRPGRWADGWPGEEIFDTWFE